MEKLLEMIYRKKEIKIKTNKNKYYIKIIDGSVDILILNDNNKEIGIEYLEEGDNIEIKYKKEKEKKIVKEIRVESVYQLNSSSSSEDNFI